MPPSAAPPRSPIAALRRSQRRTAVLFITPFFLLFTTMTAAPVLYSVWMSLFREQASSGLGFGGTRRAFVGLANYTRALSDPVFLESFLNVASYCAFYIPIMVGTGLALALVLDSAYARAKRFFQLALFLPHAVPGLIATIIWIYLYTPGLSPVLDWIQAAGGEWDFFSGGHRLSSLINMALWQWVGYNMIIFFAALQAVPREVVEAAVVDGAGAWRTALQIKVPYIRSTVVLTVLFTCVGAVQLFTEPKVLSSRAASVGEWSPMIYIVNRAFVDHDYGAAAAGAILLAAVAGGLSYVVTTLGNRWKEA